MNLLTVWVLPERLPLSKLASCRRIAPPAMMENKSLRMANILWFYWYRSAQLWWRNVFCTRCACANFEPRCDVQICDTSFYAFRNTCVLDAINQATGRLRSWSHFYTFFKAWPDRHRQAFSLLTFSDTFSRSSTTTSIFVGDCTFTCATFIFLCGLCGIPTACERKGGTRVDEGAHSKVEIAIRKLASLAPFNSLLKICKQLPCWLVRISSRCAYEFAWVCGKLRKFGYLLYAQPSPLDMVECWSWVLRLLRLGTPFLNVLQR